MEAVLELQQNIVDESGYFMRPYDFFKKALTRAKLVVLSWIYSLTHGKEDAWCSISYHRFFELGAGSSATIRAAVKELEELGEIKQNKSRKTCAAYQYTGEDFGRKGIRTDAYLYVTQFFDPTIGKRRYLTRSEIDVLSLLITLCGNEKGKGYFEGSIARIARILGLAESTVQAALNALIAMKLVKRFKTGRNGRALSHYDVYKKLLRKIRRKAQKEAKQAQAKDKPAGDFRTQAAQFADARTDREIYYARLRSEAERPVRLLEKRLSEDSFYTDTFRQDRKLEIEIAKAEYRGSPDVPKLYAEQARLKGLLANRMAELGVSAEDLKPRYRCPKCSDTGFRSDGRACDCYPPGGKR